MFFFITLLKIYSLITLDIFFRHSRKNSLDFKRSIYVVQTRRSNINIRNTVRCDMFVGAPGMARSARTGVVQAFVTGTGNPAGKRLRGASPLEAVMTGTSSRTARVSSARKNLKESAGKLPARGTRSVYEALSRWARRPIDSKPDSHPDRLDVDTTGIWEESHAPYPGRSGFPP